MDGEFKEKSMQFPGGGDTFRYEVQYIHKEHALDGRRAHMAIAPPDCTSNVTPAGYALAVQIPSITLSGRPGEKMRYYRQKSLEVLDRLNRGLHLVPSDAEFESIDELVRKAYELGK